MALTTTETYQGVHLDGNAQHIHSISYVGSGACEPKYSAHQSDGAIVQASLEEIAEEDRRDRLADVRDDFTDDVILNGDADQGTIIAWEITYETSDKEYSYAALFDGEHWHTTGDRSPNRSTGPQLVGWLVDNGLTAEDVVLVR